MTQAPWSIMLARSPQLRRIQPIFGDRRGAKPSFWLRSAHRHRHIRRDAYAERGEAREIDACGA